MDAGLGLRRLEKVQLQLENIFLQLTGANGSRTKGTADEGRSAKSEGGEA